MSLNFPENAIHLCNELSEKEVNLIYQSDSLNRRSFPNAIIHVLPMRYGHYPNNVYKFV